MQKLEYIHANPVSGKWRLAETLDMYQHSSARFYELNEEHPKVTITHHKDLGSLVNTSRIVPETGDDA